MTHTAWDTQPCQSPDAKPLLVNPHAVACVTEGPTGRTTVHTG